MTTAIEVVSFKLKESTTRMQLDSTHESINTFCSLQPGFLYRSLSCDDEGTWFDIVYWKDIKSAKAAGEAFMANEDCRKLTDLIDSSTVVMRHMDAATELVGEEAK